jgi:hypothetical protein
LGTGQPQVKTGGFKQVALFLVKVEVAGVGVGCEKSMQIGRVFVVHAAAI